MLKHPVPLAGCLLFVACGCLLLPYAGLQNDEALFGAGIYEARHTADFLTIGRREIPLMLMGYLGTLKAWLYAPLFKIWAPSALSVRLPVLLAGAATVWLFYRLLERLAGKRAALVGCALLSTDATFLLTTCFDWGPVALQHLLLVSAVVAFQDFQRARSLAAACFCCGLAAWDKALFFWLAAGLAVATAAVFPRELFRSLTRKNVAVAAGAFFMGALPLVVYNLRHPLATFRGHEGLDFSDARGKTLHLKSTLEGTALFGYIPRDDPEGHPREPSSTLERAAVRLSQATGERRTGFLPQALVVAVLLMPLVWRTPARRTLLWTATAFLVAWGLMVMTRGAGGSAHHVVLLWPLPHLFVAVAFAGASERLHASPWLPAAVAVFLAGANLLVVNQHLAQLIRNGPGKAWTDAMYGLSDALKTIPASEIYVNDWGMLDSLRLLHRGRLPLRVGSDPLSKADFNEADRRVVLQRLASPGAIFIAHSDGNEEFHGVNARMRTVVQAAGYRQQMLARIPDRNGRVLFEVYRCSR